MTEVHPAPAQSIEAILGAIGLGIVVTDTAGNVRLFNERASDILGVCGDQTTSAGWPFQCGLFLPDGITACVGERSPLFKAIAGEQGENLEVLIIAPAERTSKRWCTISFRPFRNADGKIEGAVLVIQDITVRKRCVDKIDFGYIAKIINKFARQFMCVLRRAIKFSRQDLDKYAPQSLAEFQHQLMKEALKESQEILSLALKAAKMAVWDWNFATGDVWRSAQHDDIFGYDDMLPAWTHEMFLAHVVPDDRASVEEIVYSASGTTEFSKEFRIILARDNSIRWISAQGETLLDSAGKPERMIGTVVDITQRKEFELQVLESLKSREQVFRTIVQHAPIGIATLDSQLNVIDTNDAFVLLTRCNPNQVTQRALSDVLSYKELQDAAEALINGKAFTISRLVIHPDNETPRYLDLSIWPVNKDSSVPSGAAMLVVDSTDHVLLEQHRADFIASVVHDIKNPLIGASRVFEALCDHSRNISADTHTAMLSVLKDSNQNLLSLLQNLVDVYKYETLAYPCQYEAINLKTLIETCIKQLSQLSDKHNVTVQLKLAESVDLIQADDIGMRRVLMNLLHNAIKFNQPGGTLKVTVDRLDDVVQIKVIDSGSGIGQEEQQHLFQRYMQGQAGKSYGGGTGLGLYLSKQIIEAHQGTITCHSNPGSGSTFVIALPVNKPLRNEAVSDAN